MRIRLTTPQTVLTATLLDNATSRDFAAQLPLDLTLRDHAGTEKIADLPTRLSTAGAPDGADPQVGDLTYYSPWGNLAIFYRDFEYSRGLVKIGSIDSGADRLESLAGAVTVEIAPA
ncbi:cyclophilin-like fold protein [Mycolicibacterium palauense]|uniref:cyclophilin-like fold protein n=1 Tax=Mycolicibacterium palauense TaxID=2034511 RepID=UPI000BFECB40|nr:cyclophilin-like fold protein [Mycolicibacterium palauense]